MDCQKDGDLRDLLTQIVEHWDKAERRAKQAERIRSEVVGAAVNELRYGGRRMTDALKAYLDPKYAADPNSVMTHLVEAKECAVKAEHDAIDAVIYFIDDHIRLQEDTFSPDLLLKFFPNLTTIKAKIIEVSSLIEQSRNERHNRHDIYDEIERLHVDEVIDLYKEMKASEKLLVTAADKASKKRRWQAIATWVSIAIAFGSFTVAIIAIAITK